MAKIAPARVAPQHYVDVTFDAEAGAAYHLWIRMRAQNDYFGNDSIHVQFSDAVDAGGAPIYRIGSSSADNSAQVVLQETDGGTISGWGWADQGWNGLGSHIYFATSGPHTLRIQQREDGTIFDQIVLSSVAFLTFSGDLIISKPCRNARVVAVNFHAAQTQAGATAAALRAAERRTVRLLPRSPRTPARHAPPRASRSSLAPETLHG